EEKTLDLLTKFNAMSQNAEETKLNPDIYLTTSQGQDGSTKVDDLQLQLQSIVKLRGEIQKEIVAQQIKYDSIQSLLEAGRRFKDFHNPTSTPCPSQGNEST
ncbi:hypothetical protein FOZ63_021377, partial [Perkinsus olseni]